jgi:cation transport ATPase
MTFSASDPLTPGQRRRQILQLVQDGKLTPEIGAEQLAALESEAWQRDAAPAEMIDAEDYQQAQDASFDQAARTAEIDRDIDRWRRWWVIPLWVGIVITVVAALLMAWGYSAAGMSWGFWLAWFPMLLGIFIIGLAWWSRTARWLHVRVREGNGGKGVNISLPLPLGLVAWFLRSFGQYIPPVRDQNIDEMVEMVNGALSKDEPFYVKVDEDDGGDHVEVYIG